MSFDLFLITFRNGEKATADVAAARAVLERTVFEHQSEFDAYNIKFDDGSQVEMFADGLHGGDKPFGGGMFAARGMSEAIVEFIFEFARAAGCVIFPAMEPACVLAPRADLLEHLPADLGADFYRIPIANAGELSAALKGGYSAWQAYRDKCM